MRARLRGNARWLPVGLILLLGAGCTATQGGKASRSHDGCPMSFTLSCEATRHGASRTLTNCRCVRHKDLDIFLRGR